MAGIARVACAVPGAAPRGAARGRGGCSRRSGGRGSGTRGGRRGCGFSPGGRDEGQARARSTTTAMRAAPQGWWRHARGVPRFVHVSSLAAVGPSADGVPLTEDAGAGALHALRQVEARGRADRARFGARRASRHRAPAGGLWAARYGCAALVPRRGAGLASRIGRDERYFSVIYVKDLVEGLLAAASPVAAGRTYFLAHPKAATWTELGADSRGTARPGRGALAGAAQPCLRRRLLRRDGFLFARAPVYHFAREGARSALPVLDLRSIGAPARELGWSARTGLRAGHGGDARVVQENRLAAVGWWPVDRVIAGLPGLDRGRDRALVAQHCRGAGAARAARRGAAACCGSR